MADGNRELTYLLNVCELLTVCALRIRRFPEEVCRSIFQLEYLIE